MTDQSKFGEQVWLALSDRPLGSMTRRELELMLITAAIDSGLVEPAPAHSWHKFLDLA